MLLLLPESDAIKTMLLREFTPLQSSLSSFPSLFLFCLALRGRLVFNALAGSDTVWRLGMQEGEILLASVANYNLCSHLRELLFLSELSGPVLSQFIQTPKGTQLINNAHIFSPICGIAPTASSEMFTT